LVLRKFFTHYSVELSLTTTIMHWLMRINAAMLRICASNALGYRRKLLVGSASLCLILFGRTITLLVKRRCFTFWFVSPCLASPRHSDTWCRRRVRKRDLIVAWSDCLSPCRCGDLSSLRLLKQERYLSAFSCICICVCGQ